MSTTTVWAAQIGWGKVCQNNQKIENFTWCKNDRTVDEND